MTVSDLMEKLCALPPDSPVILIWEGEFVEARSAVAQATHQGDPMRECDGSEWCYCCEDKIPTFQAVLID